MHATGQESGLIENPSAFCAGLRVLVLAGDNNADGALPDALRSLKISPIVRRRDIHSTELSHFDIVFLDLDSEGMDGIEFIRGAGRKDQALILMSAHDEELLDSVIAFLRKRQVNVPGMLSKPVTRHALAGLLAQAAVRRTCGDDHADRQPHLAWNQEDLAKALDDQQFVPFFQPQIELATRKPVSVEALARWLHPESGFLPPSQFIEVMERTGLIDRLFEALLRQSLARLRQWDACDFSIGLAINVSPVTLQNPDLPDIVSDMVKEFGISPGRITIEVTETAMAQEPDRLLETALRLRLRGFKLSVDDFGTGYSTLLQLSEMPFTEVKIDRELVAGISDSKKTAAIFESVVGLANKLGMCTVAEGIQSRQDHELVQALGCRFGQAYYFAKPMSNTDLVRHLAYEPLAE